ncbi:hypothetical protein BB561_003236 [Smittium simulii]|uniref:DNA polymerase epsilon subunit n=1 Tax=Smittium simulii TaxID=133385 RepID=A0A2T9YML7_9FUNG|nr:hypothetical protein BB561_003236 [Smittium simulii]
MKTEKLVYTVFTKKFGISLKADASRFLVSCIKNASQDSELATEWLESIASEWTQLDNSCLLVELEALKDLLKKMSQQASNSFGLTHSVPNSENVTESYDISKKSNLNKLDEKNFFSVVDAYDVPQLWYDSSKSIFVTPDLLPKFANSQNKAIGGKSNNLSDIHSKNTNKIKYSGLITSPEIKAGMFRQRYDTIRQLLQRNETYLRETSLGNTWNNNVFVDTIGSIKGRENQTFVIFGMITQIEEGFYHIEDKDHIIKLDLSQMKLEKKNYSGIITRDSFVLIEGNLNDDVFVVDSIMQPPAEPRTKSVSYYKGTDFFGGPEFTQDNVTLQAIEALDDNGIIVFVSEIWLDKSEVLEQLKKLFSGFLSSRLPLAFVFIGNFNSIPYTPGNISIIQYQENMNKLADLILEFPEIAKQCYFVFVPGPGDPWANFTLPYEPLPSFITDRFKTRIPKSIFTTNPCRIKFCTQEITVFRQDLVKKMRRNCVLWPNGKDEIFEEHVVKTLINQSHLSPLPTKVSPVFWGYDHTLRIYPTPHLIVLADEFEPYDVCYNGALAINPGSFSCNGFRFSVYLPSTKTTQLR